MPLRRLALATLLVASAEVVRADGDPPAEEPAPESQPAPRVMIRGFGNIDYRHVSEGPPSTFAVGQLDIFMTSELSDSLSVLAEVVAEAEDNEEMVIDVERYQLRYSPADWLNVAVGRMHTVLGYWNQTYHHGTWFQTTASRPEVYRFEDEGGVLPIHEVGVQLLGARRIGGLQAEYNLSLTNGRGRTREEIAQVQDLDSSKAVNLWLGLRPKPAAPLYFGGVARFDTIPPSEARPGDLDERILGGFVTFQRAGVEALGELIRVRHTDDRGGSFDTTGYYVQGAYALGRFKPYYRFDALEIADEDPFYAPVVGDLRKHTLGLRADPWTWAALKLEIFHDDPDPGGTATGLAIQAAFTF